jgi:hypothetical protein
MPFVFAPGSWEETNTQYLFALQGNIQSAKEYDTVEKWRGTVVGAGSSLLISFQRLLVAPCARAAAAAAAAGYAVLEARVVGGWWWTGKPWSIQAR